MNNKMTRMEKRHRRWDLSDELNLGGRMPKLRQESRVNQKKNGGFHRSCRSAGKLIASLWWGDGNNGKVDMLMSWKANSKRRKQYKAIDYE